MYWMLLGRGNRAEVTWEEKVECNCRLRCQFRQCSGCVVVDEYVNMFCKVNVIIVENNYGN